MIQWVPLSGIWVSKSSSTEPIGILLPIVLWWIKLIESRGNSLPSRLDKSLWTPKWNFSFHLGARQFLNEVVWLLYSSYGIFFPEPDLACRKASICGSAFPCLKSTCHIYATRSYLHCATSYIRFRLRIHDRKVLQRWCFDWQVTKQSLNEKDLLWSCACQTASSYLLVHRLQILCLQECHRQYAFISRWFGLPSASTHHSI